MTGMLKTKIAPADPTPLCLARIFGRETFVAILGLLAARSDLAASCTLLSEWLRRTSHLRPPQICGRRFGRNLIPVIKRTYTVFSAASVQK